TIADFGVDIYYMVAAVQAHENLHVTQYQAAIAPAYVTLKTALEALTVPLDAYATAGAAKAAIKALPTYEIAKQAFDNAHIEAQEATARHQPKEPFINEEHKVIDPMIALIDRRMAALSCR